MTDINILFCRTLLSSVMEEVKKMTTGVERKAAWVYHFKGFGDHWEFHGPDKFYWHGSADNAYDARAKGWQAWLAHLEREHVDMAARLNGVKERESAARAVR